MMSTMPEQLQQPTMASLVAWGKWVAADEAYFALLWDAFRKGYADCPTGTSFCTFAGGAMRMDKRRILTKCLADKKLAHRKLVGMDLTPLKELFKPHDVPLEQMRTADITAARCAWQEWARRHRGKGAGISFEAPAAPLLQLQVHQEVHQEVAVSQNQAVSVDLGNAISEIARLSDQRVEAEVARVVAGAGERAQAGCAEAAEARAKAAEACVKAAEARAEAAEARAEAVEPTAKDNETLALRAQLEEVGARNAELEAEAKQASASYMQSSEDHQRIVSFLEQENLTLMLEDKELRAEHLRTKTAADAALATSTAQVAVLRAQLERAGAQMADEREQLAARGAEMTQILMQERKERKAQKLEMVGRAEFLARAQSRSDAEALDHKKQVDHLCAKIVCLDERLRTYGS